MEEITEWIIKSELNDPRQRMEDGIELISPLIRCKDCIYYTGGIDGYCDRWFRRTGGNMSFCNEAEKLVR